MTLSFYDGSDYWFLFWFTCNGKYTTILNLKKLLDDTVTVIKSKGTKRLGEKWSLGNRAQHLLDLATTCKNKEHMN